MDQNGMPEIIRPVLRMPVVEVITGYKKSTLYAKIKSGDFPAPVKLGLRAVAWRYDEIAEWVATREKAGGSSS